MCGKRPTGGYQALLLTNELVLTNELAATSENHPARTSRCCAPGDAACPRPMRRRYVCCWQVQHLDAKAGGAFEYRTDTMDIAGYLTQGGQTAGHRGL